MNIILKVLNTHGIPRNLANLGMITMQGSKLGDFIALLFILMQNKEILAVDTCSMI